MDEPQLGLARQRLTRLFQFLEGFNELRNPVVREIDRPGDFALWLDTLPEHAAVTQGWGDEDADFVLAVSRPRLRDGPAPPSEILDWLLSDWRELDSEVVVIPRRLRHGAPPENDLDEVDPENIEAFEDDPARMGAIDAWRGQRETWIERERPALAAMRVFERLYALYGELERENGQIELVAGDAVLNWSVQSGRNFHPIVLQTVQIELEPEVPRLVVTISDRAPELYTSLLRAIEEVDGRVLPQVLSEFEAGEYDPFSGGEMDGFLRGLASRLHPRGEFAGIGTPSARPGAPTIGRRPVLFTRKRSQGFATAIEAILEDVEERESFPNSLLSIIGIEPPISPSANEPIEAILRPANEDPGILFTKPANEEQAQIARRLERYQAVMVQGPPGTGKTHTIANLIGHLLSEGKRVLVTSHTAKALERVREVIVDDLQPLAVSVVSNDLAGRAQLEQSVTEITRHLSSDSPEQLRRDAARLQLERTALLEQLDGTRRTLRNAVASEYRPVVVDGAEITPPDAAREVHRGLGEHDWIPGPLLPGTLSLTVQEILDLYRTNTTIAPEDEQHLAYALPDLSVLWSPQTFVSLVSRQAELANLDREFGAQAWTRDPDTDSAEAFERYLRAAEDAAATLREAADWEWQVIDAGRRGGGYGETWEHLLGEIQSVGALADKAAPLIGRRGPHLPDSIDIGRLISALRSMHEHARGGGSFGRMTLMLRGEWSHTLKVCDVAHGDKREPEALESLLVLAELTSARRSLGGLWERVVGSAGGPSTESLGEAPEVLGTQLAARIRQLLDWYGASWLRLVGALGGLGLSVQALPGKAQPELGPHAELTRLRRLAEDAIPRALVAKDAAIRLAEGTEALAEAERRLAQFDGARTSDGPVRRLREAIAVRNAVAYTVAYERLVDLTNRVQAALTRIAHLARVEEVAPAWAAAIRDRAGPHAAGVPPGDVALAWRWGQLDGELSRRAAISPDELQARIEQLSRDLQRCTGQLVSARAWAAQIEHTTQPQQAALKGWQETMRRIGRGTGKRVPRLQAAARKLMGESRNSVPVWIMPLSRVVETFDFHTTRFDVVIIDEASQSDLLAMTALYLGRQVVIVGDHEQVSPDAVGQRVENTQRLIDQFLTDIPNNELYDGRASIYDLGGIAFTGSVQLREHFRCVPDIIQFSNELSYNGKIQPLRDAGDVKLRPHVVSHRVEGSRTGSTTRAVNHEEADFISSAIVAACEFDEYRDATFGVISMLGEEQARLIDSMLRQRLLPAEFARRRILAGNPPQFQGDERDVVFLSLVDSPGDGPLTMRQDESLKKRYNVAASRAKDQLWVVHSLSVEHDLKPGDLRERLIRHAMAPSALQAKISAVITDAESPFESAVAAELVRRAYRVDAQHRVGGYRIDLVVTGPDSRRIAIECDGERWHTDDNLDQDLARQAQLERLRWRFVRIRGSEYYRDPERTMDRVCARLAEHGVLQFSADPEPSVPQTSELLERLLARAAALRRTPGRGVPLEYDDAAAADHTATGRRNTANSPQDDLQKTQASPSPERPNHDRARTLIDAAEFEQSGTDRIRPPRASPRSEPSTTTFRDHIDEAASSESGLNLPAYRQWVSTQPVHDPREAATSHLRQILTEVVAAEGPIIARRAYRLINNASGGQRLAKTARSALNRAAAQAVRSGQLLEANPLDRPGQLDKVLRLPNTTAVVVRARGPRDLDEVPPDEVGALLARVRGHGAGTDEDAKRALLDAYGLKRLTPDVDQYLSQCIRLSDGSRA